MPLPEFKMTKRTKTTPKTVRINDTSPFLIEFNLLLILINYAETVKIDLYKFLIIIKEINMAAALYFPSGANPPGGAPIQTNGGLKEEAQLAGFVITQADGNKAIEIPFGYSKKHEMLIQRLEEAGYQIKKLDPKAVSIVQQESGAAAAVALLSRVAGDVVSAAGRVFTSAYEYTKYQLGG
jgi:hypothetical protein